MRYLRFIYRETGLIASKKEIIHALGEALHTEVRLRRFTKGRGWGVKYLVQDRNTGKTAAVVKAASRSVERRIEKRWPDRYLHYTERFSRECRLLERLASAGLGPRVVLCAGAFFAREYLPGSSLLELPPARVAGLIGGVCDTLEAVNREGIPHTDPNPGNIILEPETGRLRLIDCENPLHAPESPEVLEKLRVYNHERFIHVLGRELRASRDSGGLEEIAAAVESTYTRPGSPVPADRALALLRGETQSVRLPDNET